MFFNTQAVTSNVIKIMLIKKKNVYRNVKVTSVHKVQLLLIKITIMHKSAKKFNWVVNAFYNCFVFCCYDLLNICYFIYYISFDFVYLLLFLLLYTFYLPFFIHIISPFFNCSVFSFFDIFVFCDMYYMYFYSFIYIFIVYFVCFVWCGFLIYFKYLVVHWAIFSFSILFCFIYVLLLVNHLFLISIMHLFLGGAPTSICHFFRLSIHLSRTVSQEPYTIWS